MEIKGGDNFLKVLSVWLPNLILIESIKIGNNTKPQRQVRRLMQNGLEDYGGNPLKHILDFWPIKYLIYFYYNLMVHIKILINWHIVHILGKTYNLNNLSKPPHFLGYKVEILKYTFVKIRKRCDNIFLSHQKVASKTVFHMFTLLSWIIK